MKGIDMLEIISNVDPKHIKAADEIYISNISHWSKRFSAIAACIAVLLVVGIGAWAIGAESGKTKLPEFLQQYTIGGYTYYLPKTDAEGMREMPKYKGYAGDLMDTILWNRTGQIEIVKDVPIIDENGRLLYSVNVYGLTSEDIDNNYTNCIKTIESMGLKIADIDLTMLGRHNFLIYMTEGEATSLGYQCPKISKVLLIESYMYDPEDGVWYGRAYIAKKHGGSYNY